MKVHKIMIFMLNGAWEIISSFNLDYHVPLYIITDMTNVLIHLDTFFHYICKITFFESKCTKHVNGFSL